MRWGLRGTMPVRRGCLNESGGCCRGRMTYWGLTHKANIGGRSVSYRSLLITTGNQVKARRLIYITSRETGLSTSYIPIYNLRVSLIDRSSESFALLALIQTVIRPNHPFILRHPQRLHDLDQIKPNRATLFEPAASYFSH